MNWEAIGALGDNVGGIIVAATLIYPLICDPRRTE